CPKVSSTLFPCLSLISSFGVRLELTLRILGKIVLLKETQKILENDFKKCYNAFCKGYHK
ncbi:hypothetical protein Q7W32_11180, partial [Streptococcus suis]|nr:hypothetical protein [Streptococcus suis]